jgi:cobalt-zinc-cadmium efflux system outer membrane protein
MFPDPQLDVETTNNGVNKDMGYVYGTSVGWTLELGGKRKARINLAKNQSELSKIQDFSETSGRCKLRIY